MCHNETITRHNETWRCHNGKRVPGSGNAAFRYDTCHSNYDNVVLCYDTRTLRYDTVVFRYDAWVIRYDKPGIWADAGPFRSSEGAFLPIFANVQFNADGTVRPSPSAMSNAERQRRFRRRNPDYYRLRKAKQRAEIKARVMAMRLEAQKAAEQVVCKEPLLLPAPVETVELPGLTALSSQDAVPFPELVHLVRRRDAA